MAGWIRVESDIHRHPKVVALPSPAARWAFVVTLAEGKAVDGRWTSIRHYRACVPSQEARHLPALIHVGLVFMDGEAVVVHDWDDYQVRKDQTAAERQRRHRDRQRDPDASPEDVTPPAVTSRRDSQDPSQRDVTEPSRAVSLSLSMSRSEPNPEEPYQVRSAGSDALDAMALVEELTGRPFGWGTGSPVADTLIADVKDLGLDRVTAEYRAVRTEANGTPIDVAGVVYGAHKRLYRIPSAPGTGPAAKKPKGLQPDQSEVDRAFDQH